MKELKQITVIGLGLLGSSITLAVSRSFPRTKTVGYSHRAGTRKKARQMAVADVVCNDIKAAVRDADIVILATPIYTFEQIFAQISNHLPAGCIVTDVGSTKVLPHIWAAKHLRADVFYVGSHPIAGSEQRGVEFSRDDLFYQALCILTKTKTTSKSAVQVLSHFWSKLGCDVKVMSPSEHDRILANISHLPHVTAVSLVNAQKNYDLKYAGKGFSDTSRIASGPANIWSDVLLSNANNLTKGIDRVFAELKRMKKAIKSKDKKAIETLLEAARNKRSAMVSYKMKKRELL